MDTIEPNDNLLDIEAAADVLIEKLRANLLNTREKIVEFEAFRRKLHEHEQAERRHRREVEASVRKVAEGIDRMERQMSEKSKIDGWKFLRNLSQFVTGEIDKRVR